MSDIDPPVVPPVTPPVTPPAQTAPAQEDQFTQAQVDAKIAEASAKAVNDFKAGKGRNEKQIQEEAVAAFKAQQDKATLEEEGKFQELNKTLSSEKAELETKLAEANSKIEPLTDFQKKVSDTTATENASILSELEKNVTEDKKEQFETLKKSLPEDPFAQKQQLMALKSLFGDPSTKKNSPKTPGINAGDDAGLTEALKAAKKNTAEKQSSYGKWRKK